MTGNQDDTQSAVTARNQRPPVLIAGMHRSGTSLVAKLLFECGLDLGPETRLAPAKLENPEGFFENLDFVDINEEIFAALGAGWDDSRHLPVSMLTDEVVSRLRQRVLDATREFEGTRPWGWKDPRNSVTAPFWRKMFPGAKFVLCLRHPLEVALSLRRRNFFSWETGLALWLHYNEALLGAVPSGDRVVTHYGRYFGDASVEIRRIASFCGLETDEATVDAATRSARRELRSSRFTRRHLIDAGVSSRVLGVYDELCREAEFELDSSVGGGGGRPPDRSEAAAGGSSPFVVDRVVLDRILDDAGVSSAPERAAAASSGLIASLSRTNEAQQRKLRELEASIQALEARLSDVSAGNATRKSESASALAEVEGELAHMREAYLQAQSELHEIHASRLWKMGLFYWRAVRALKTIPERRARRARSRGTSTRGESSRADDATGTNASTSSRVPAKPKRTPSEELVATLIAELSERLGSAFSILDWDTRLSLADSCPSQSVFTPVTDMFPLPYIDSSVDVVALRDGEPELEREARRVASGAVVTILGGAHPAYRVEWTREKRAAGGAKATIVIPVHNQLHHTKACLAALETTLPREFEGEIFVVDDASTDETWAFLQEWERGGTRRVAFRNEANLGFIDSCNLAAGKSSGEILVFLNNDTIPREGWLDALLATFVRYPDAGAVGGKLVYPDGRLQEAGGRIFSDASGINMGKFDPCPDAPIYNFVRDVDYCSGALLATRRALWEEIGGFDARFRPAYYEDTDYCFSVRARGWRVLYQPESVVVHVEGATSGTDLSSGAKRYQVVNREKFVEKWKDVLSQHPSPPDRVDYALIHRLAFPEGCKRILIINHTVPEYDKESGSKRLFDLIRALRDSGWAVSFMAPWVAGGERYVRELQQMGVATYEKGLTELGDRRHKREAYRLIATGMFDVALICFWHIAEEWAPTVRAMSGRTKVVVDSVDLHLLRNMRSTLRPGANGPIALLDGKFADEMRRELNLYASVDRVLTVSEKEASLISDFVSRPGHARSVPDVEELAPSPWSFEERSGIAFIGSFRHPPNVEAVKYLFGEILPRIDRSVLEQHPLYVVGTDMSDEIRRLARGFANVRMVGWVPSVTPYLERARISVLPLLSGAGTKRKLIQACMIGTPSVATSIAAEGLDLVDGEDVLIANDPEAFASRIVSLLADHEQWARLSRSSRAKLVATHGTEVGRQKLLEALDLTVERARR